MLFGIGVGLPFVEFLYDRWYYSYYNKCTGGCGEWLEKPYRTCHWCWALSVVAARPKAGEIPEGDSERNLGLSAQHGVR